MTAAAETSGIASWFQRWVGQGLDDLPTEERRSARLLNIAATATAPLTATFGIGYAIHDLAALWPAVLACVALVSALLTTPLVMARNFLRGVLWLSGAMLCGFTFIPYVIGAESWVHTTLSTPYIAGIFLAVGLTRLRLAIVLSAVSFFLALIAEVFFIGPAWADEIDPTMLLIVKVNMMIANATVVACLAYLAIKRVTMAERALAVEHARSEALLDNLLPEKIALRLKDAPDQIIADSIGQATILFADIVDFTPRAATMPPEDLIRFLNRVFTAFDEETDQRGLEKIKTIGDAYMVAAGMPEPRDDHADAIAKMAIRMLAITEEISQTAEQPVTVRIGIHTGPAVAGVIGVRKFFYNVWGDTVNTASRMKSHGEPGRIQVTEETMAALGDAYVFEPRGMIEIKGKGSIETWWLTGRAI